MISNNFTFFDLTEEDFTSLGIDSVTVCYTIDEINKKVNFNVLKLNYDKTTLISTDVIYPSNLIKYLSDESIKKITQEVSTLCQKFFNKEITIIDLTPIDLDF